MEYGDKLCGILQSIYADEVWVVRTGGVPEVQGWTSCCHSRYHQHYLPAASRLELLQAMPMGVCGMRCAMGQDLGIVP